MPASARNAKGSLALVMLAALSVTAMAADTSPPAAPAAAPSPPSPAAIAAADTILADVGIKQSVALVVPAMMTELEQNVTKTRPEIRDSLRETLKAIKPEFDKTAEQTYNTAATLLAQQMTEKEIVDVAAFFESPAGKKYLAVEPVFRQKFSSVAVPWQDKLSTDILVRAREEMRKKGIEF
ncbi:MAG TPA: DUF2059 domain-containing protein [Roseiarcus sp.]|nr:DUF2059 domain-containing protein [Roseiarcus sp.]